MDLELAYEKADEIPTGMEALYTERDGKHVLTGIKGLKTQSDVDKVMTSLTKERNEHKATKDKLARFGGHEPDKLAADLVELDELRTFKQTIGEGGKIDDAKIDALVEGKIKARLAPIERERDTLKTQVGELQTTNVELDGTIRRGKIHDAVRKHATELKVVGTALDDVLMYAERLFEVDQDGNVIARDGSGITPGTGPKDWLTDQQKTRPHWWPPNEGGNSSGGNRIGGVVNNPWTKEHWNMTSQGAYVREHGEEKARAAAKAAGSALGATKPAA